jgi:hypothetical protein
MHGQTRTCVDTDLGRLDDRDMPGEVFGLWCFGELRDDPVYNEGVLHIADLISLDTMPSDESM